MAPVLGVLVEAREWFAGAIEMEVIEARGFRGHRALTYTSFSSCSTSGYTVPFIWLSSLKSFSALECL
jgi:hypothetical protein